ncbi:DNA polymerase-3 subunit delta' [Palleronia aestuarii]|uniref:DNA polymerase-3 subunit delta n=1 Tax=Palleronia aestuarii TaxID=568105 RepID=A0A2W7NBT1_9RHOB|nr:DNA polymerase III subunit delta' [Palleronia aestuarii]PZX17811.1 DNA polymerase-3 subunit delta' [Palleronia aestuarii]
MSEAASYEPDRVEGVPHPRHATRLFGQEAAERTFLDALRSDRLHHAWLLSGPRGIGKATLAWRIARALLAVPGDGAVTDSLDVPADHPVAARIAALSEPRLLLMRPTLEPTRGTERREITVDVARRARDFLHMSAADGGMRIVIVDSADLLNVAAANAILKLLEEPPARTIFLLVCHAPSRLLPTIRSRCRTLRCHPLAGPDIAAALEAAGLRPDIEPAALTQLAEGSAGEAARLLQQDGPSLYADLVGIFSSETGFDRASLSDLAAGLAGPGTGGRFEIAIRLIDLMLARLARRGAGMLPEAEAAKGEAALLARLAPDMAAGRLWASRQQEVTARLAHGRAVNLDPSALILDTGLKINETGRAILAR